MPISRLTEWGVAEIWPNLRLNRRPGVARGAQGWLMPMLARAGTSAWGRMGMLRTSIQSAIYITWQPDASRSIACKYSIKMQHTHIPRCPCFIYLLGQGRPTGAGWACFGHQYSPLSILVGNRMLSGL